MIDEQVLDRVPFGRRRFLARTGAVLTGVAARLWFPNAAFAAVPNGCHGYNECTCCSGSTCCRGDCRGGYYGCESGTQCWYSCAYIGSTLYRIRCCDWGYGTSGRCICRAITGPC